MRSEGLVLSKLKLKCMEQGGPQYMIAALAGLSPSRLSEYVLLQKEIPGHHLVALCRVLGCEPEDIMGVAENYDVGIWERREPAKPAQA